MNIGRVFYKFLAGHKRWWVFLFLVVGLTIVLVWFGQSTPYTSFIYAMF